MKKLLGLILVCVFFYFGCGNQDKKDVRDSVVINYTKDARTGLCFAYTKYDSYGGYTILSITCVPCSQAVENLIPKP